VKSYPQLQRYAGQVSNFEAAALVEQVKSHCGDLFGVVGTGIWQASDNHISVANRLNLLENLPVHYSSKTSSTFSRRS
jgi:hypothetical protein